MIQCFSVFVFEGVFASGTKVVPTDSVRCVLSCHSTPIPVSRPSLETAPRLSPVPRPPPPPPSPPSPKEHNTTPSLGLYTGCLWVRALCPLVLRPHLETGALASQPTQYFAGFLLRLASTCLLFTSFFLFPFADLLFRLRSGQGPGTEHRPSILKVGLHHDVPAVLDHGQGEQDHAPPHHAAQKVRLCLQVLEVFCLGKK